MTNYYYEKKFTNDSKSIEKSLKWLETNFDVRSIFREYNTIFIVSHNEVHQSLH